jgi:O-succinylbenzoate synthase
MRIEKLTIYHLDMPLVHPFETSFGLETRRECLIMAAEGGGVIGWGECVALNIPSYSYETIGTAWHVLEDFLVPAVLNLEWDQITDFFEAFRWVRGHNMAKAGLQCAAWDLMAKSEGISLAEKLGEPYPENPADRIKVGISIGIQPSIDATLTRIEDFISQGFSRVKLKIKPGWDLELLQAVREVYPTLPLMVDANSAYRLTDAEHIKRFDELDLIMIEQPLAHDDIYQHSQLQRLLKTPICLDESITSLEQAEWALEIDAARIINIKPGRVGGLWESRQIHDLCAGQGIPVWCGGMLETGIGRAANLALASLPNFKLPSDNGPTHRYWEQDIIEEEFILNAEDSTINRPYEPGLGVKPDPDRIKEFLIRKKTFRA